MGIESDRPRSQNYIRIGNKTYQLWEPFIASPSKYKVQIISIQNETNMGCEYLKKIRALSFVLDLDMCFLIMLHEEQRQKCNQQLQIWGVERTKNHRRKQIGQTTPTPRGWRALTRALGERRPPPRELNSCTFKTYH